MSDLIRREHVKNMLQMVAEQFWCADDDLQAAFFNTMGDQWRMIKERHGWNAEIQICMAAKKLTKDGRQIILEMAEFIKIGGEA